ncbi:MAG: polysaccharide pyruvyl transferase family protein [Synechococcus sp. ELA057]
MQLSYPLCNNSPVILDHRDSPLVLIGGTKGFVPSSWRNSVAQNILRSGDNTGNLVFQYAINHILKANKLFIAQGERFKFADIRQGRIDYYLMPAANHLRLDADWTDFNSFLRKIEVPIIVVGLGAQSQLQMTASECASSLRSNKSVVDFVELLEEKAIYIGYRGDFSMEVGSSLGLSKGEVIGCPSLMINENPALGQNLRDQIDALAALAIDTPNGFSSFLCLPESPYSFEAGSEQAMIQRILVSYAMQNNGFLLQQSGGCDAINYFTGNFGEIGHEKLAWMHDRYQVQADLQATKEFFADHGLIFFSAYEWIDAMNDMLFSLGSRFHGNMLSIASARPGVVIYHDARTSELAECMEVPRISRHDFIQAFNADNPMREFFSSVRFDADNFDKSRRSLAAKWVDISSSTGISIADHVVDIANA